MAGNTKSIVKDLDNKPAPQYFNPVADAYEYLLGRNGANRVELYGPDGTPLRTSGGALDVKATEILAQLDITLSALRDALRGVDSKTLSDLATLLTAIKDTAGVKKITDAVDVADRAARVLGKITADDAAIAALGALAAAAVTDPSASASVIALLKGLLKQLQGTGTGSVPTTLTGRKIAIPAQKNYDQVLNVAAGQGVNITITPPAGEIWRVKILGIYIDPPTGATTGTHSIQIFTGDQDSKCRYINAVSAYNGAIEINSNYIKLATISKEPTQEQTQAIVLAAIVGSNASPIIIRYANATDVSTNKTIYIRMTVEVEYVVA